MSQPVSNERFILQFCLLSGLQLPRRYHSIFFVQVGHETTYASSENQTYLVDIIQRFLGKLDMKPHMHRVKIVIFPKYRIMVRPTNTIKQGLLYRWTEHSILPVTTEGVISNSNNATQTQSIFVKF